MNKPVMSKEVEAQVDNAVQMYLQRVKWIEWGMSTLRKQGACILLEGEPGTGKTVIAEYLALAIVKKGIREIAFADFGSKTPGENERQIRALFEAAKKNKNQTIYLDECDGVLMDRNLLASDSAFMVSIVNELLMQIGKYPGLVILSTNNPQKLDPAIKRRILAKVVVGMPGHRERIMLWKSKWPKKLPLQLKTEQFEELAELVITGAEVENALIEGVSDALRRKTTPKFEDICISAKSYADARATR